MNMKRSIKSFIAVSVCILYFAGSLFAQQATKKTIKMNLWKEKKAEDVIVSQKDSTVNLLEKKQKEMADLKRDAAKKLHTTAIRYASEYHNSGAEFEYSFAQDADPIVNLLKTAEESDLRIDSLFCSLRILVNASKSCEYIRDCSLNALLESLSSCSNKYFASEDDATNKKKIYRQIETTIYDHAKQSLDFSLASPAVFSSNLANKLFKFSSNAFKPTQTKEWQERLRGLIFRFLENNIGKTLWDASDSQGIWDSVLSSANSLYQLSKVLEHMDDLDDLLWSLTRRFVWFLDFSAGQFPATFYENIEESIKDGSTFFLELGEQDEEIVTKKSMLLDALKKAKAKALESNIFVDKADNFLKVAQSDETLPNSTLMEPLSILFEDSPKKASIVTAKAESSVVPLPAVAPVETFA